MPTDIIQSISFVSAIAVFASTFVALSPFLNRAGVGSFIWQWLKGVLGILPPRKKTWGVVYDANTKRPIPFVRVQLFDKNKRVLETRIADSSGRYGFLTAPESLLAQNVQISIAPNAKGYGFPSRTPVSVDTFVYNNLYHGELLTVSEKMLINFDIPMDPVRPSVAPLIVKSPSIVLGASVAALADTGFWLGLIMVPLNFILNPNPFTLGVVFLFLGTASLRVWGIQEHPFGIVVDGTSGHPMPFALITLNDMTGTRVAFAVSDEYGRYFIITKRGTYTLNIVTPATILPMRRMTKIVEAKKGWITQKLTI